MTDLLDRLLQEAEAEEKRAFRNIFGDVILLEGAFNKNNIKKYTLCDIRDFIYAYIVGLRILSLEPKTATQAVSMAHNDAIAISMSDALAESKSDLASALDILTTPPEYSGVKQNSQCDRLSELKINTDMISNWLNSLSVKDRPSYDEMFFNRLRMNLGLQSDRKAKAIGDAAAYWLGLDYNTKKTVANHLAALFSKFPKSKFTRMFDRVVRSEYYDPSISKSRGMSTATKMGIAAIAGVIAGHFWHKWSRGK